MKRRGEPETRERGLGQWPLREPLAYHGSSGIEDRAVAGTVAWMREAQ